MIFPDGKDLNNAEKNELGLSIRALIFGLGMFAFSNVTARGQKQPF